MIRIKEKDSLFFIEVTGYAYDAEEDKFHVMLTGMSMYDRDRLEVDGSLRRSYDTGWFTVPAKDVVSVVLDKASEMADMIGKDYYSTSPLKSATVIVIFDERELFRYRERELDKIAVAKVDDRIEAEAGDAS